MANKKRSVTAHADILVKNKHDSKHYNNTDVMVLNTANVLFICGSEPPIAHNKDGSKQLVYHINNGQPIPPLRDQTIKELVDVLTPVGWLKCHKSYIVNTAHITGWHGNTKDGFSFEVNNKSDKKYVPISRRDRAVRLNFKKKSTINPLGRTALW